MQANRNMTLNAFLEGFFFPSKSTAWSKGTMRANKGQIALYVSPRLGMSRLGMISPSMLGEFFETMAGKYSLSVIRNLFYLVAGAMRLAEELGAIKIDPTLKLEYPDAPVTLGAAPTPDQILLLLKGVKPPQDRCVLTLIICCRPFAHRLFALRWGDLSGEYLNVKAGSPPTLLRIAAQQALNKWRARCPDDSPEAYMFVSRRGEPFRRPSDFEKRHVYPVARRLGIPQHLVTVVALRRALVPRHFLK